MEPYEKRVIQQNILQLHSTLIERTSLVDCLWKNGLQYRELEAPNRPRIASLPLGLLRKKGSFEPLKSALRDDGQLGAYELLCKRQGNENWKQYGDIEIDRNARIGMGAIKTEVFEGRKKSVDVKHQIFAVKRVTYRGSFVFAMNEIKMLQVIPNHQNIVQLVLSAHVNHKYAFLPLEKCSCSLQRIVEDKNYSIPKINILMQMVTGLRALHESGIVHGNLEPRNILLAFYEPKDAIVKLADFGLSCKDGEKRLAKDVDYESYVKEWCAPEILAQLDTLLDEPSAENPVFLVSIMANDIFSLGCIFAYVGSDGVHPFGCGTRCLTNILDGKNLLGHMDANDIQILVLKMLSHHPSRRPLCYQVYSELAQINNNNNNVLVRVEMTSCCSSKIQESKYPFDGKKMKQRKFSTSSANGYTSAFNQRKENDYIISGGQVELKICSRNIKDSILPVFQKLIYDIMQNHETNTSIIMELGSLCLFDWAELNPILHGKFQTERQRILCLSQLIGSLGSVEIKMCLEKLCNLEDLKKKSLRFRKELTRYFPDGLQIVKSTSEPHYCNSCKEKDHPDVQANERYSNVLT